MKERAFTFSLRPGSVGSVPEEFLKEAPDNNIWAKASEGTSYILLPCAGHEGQAGINATPEANFTCQIYMQVINTAYVMSSTLIKHHYHVSKYGDNEIMITRIK